MQRFNLAWGVGFVHTLVGIFVLVIVGVRSMAGAQAADESSMEDILASIRKIIQEDESQISDDVASSSASDTAVAPAVSDQDDVDALFDDDKPANIETESNPSGADPDANAAHVVETPDEMENAMSVDGADDTVLLTPGMRDHDASQRLQAVSHDEKPQEAPDIDMPVSDDLEALQSGDKALQVVKGVAEGDLDFVDKPIQKPLESKSDSVSTKPPPVVSPVASEPLTSPEVSAIVSQQLSSLTRLSAQGEGRTLEDLVVAMLTPMLKGWLDNNLPQLVEKKVAEELKRLSQQ